MQIDLSHNVIAADDFARRFSMRSGNLMWLLGAGASAAAGVPTAADMIWEFKQQLYVSQRRASPKSVADLSNPAVRNVLQSFVDSLERFPAPNSPDEYAALFEAAYASEGDRRSYIAAKLSGAKPSYGHIALATLMKANRTRIVWTTNFDPLVADACAKVYDGTGHLTTVALDAPDLGGDALTTERWPVEVKLHGDFRSRRLKNTGDELRQQDVRLRDLLAEWCRRSGLIVAGYSGRDDSIMTALESVLDQSTPFPGGLFWLHRGDDPPLPRVSQFLAKASAKGVEGGLVPIENFDEGLRDLVRLLKDLDTTALGAFAESRRIWSPAVGDPGANRGFPVIRFNALEVKTMPSVCRRVDCTIGGHAEVAAAIAEAKVGVLATRTKAGVLGFGADADIRTAFGPRTIKEFDLHTIEVRRLRYDSTERGLLRQALSQALAREHGLTLVRRRNTDLLSPTDPSAPQWRPLKRLVNVLSGSVPGHPELLWGEGIGTRLDWADDRLWLLVDPRTVMSGVDDGNRAAATDFSREQTVRRYNKQLNELISFWATMLAARGAELRALGVSAGVDAVFQLGADTAFSRRSQG